MHPINGICPPNLSQFYPMKIPKIYDVISVWRLSPEKQIEVLLHATSLIRKRDREIKVCIVGTGPCRNKLERLVGKLNLVNNVDFVGFQQSVEYYYNSSRILVLT